MSAPKKYAGGKHATPLKPRLELRESPIHGLGVFLVGPTCPEGTVIENSPVLPLKSKGDCDLGLMNHVLKHGNGEAVGLGYLMLYNHSYEPNAEMIGDGQPARIVRALRAIKPGEEITVRYKCAPWWT